MGEEHRETIKVTRTFKIGVALQAASAGLVGAGIGIEIAMKADLGYLLITIGAFLFGLGSKLMRI